MISASSPIEAFIRFEIDADTADNGTPLGSKTKKETDRLKGPRRFNVRTLGPVRPHYDAVTALAASPNGQESPARFASLAGEARVSQWCSIPVLADVEKAKNHAAGISLCLNKNGDKRNARLLRAYCSGS